MWDEDFDSAPAPSQPAQDSGVGDDFFTGSFDQTQSVPQPQGFDDFEASLSQGSNDFAPSPHGSFDQNSFGSMSFEQSSPAQGGMDDFAGSFGEPSPASPSFNSFDSSGGNATGSFEGNNFTDPQSDADFLSAEQPAPSPASFNSFESSGSGHGSFEGNLKVEQTSPQKPSGSSNIGALMGNVQVVSEIMRQYELEHEKFLVEKQAQERKLHNEVVETAKKDLNKFYEERKRRAEGAKGQHGSQKYEDSKPADDKAAWQQLSSLVNLGDGSESTERMRNLLMDMKHSS